MNDTRIRLALVMSLPMVLGGCEHAVWGNAMALGMTVCLFVGTLQLGRKPGARSKGESQRPPQPTPFSK